MSKKNKQAKNRSKPQKKQESVFKEAWENMSEDFDKLMPEKLKGKDKKKFALWLFILELLILGVVGKFIYDWFVK